MRGFFPRLRPHQWRLHLAAMFFFGLVAFIILYPILTHTNTHTAGYDFFAYNWNFWWARYALQHPAIDLFQSNYVMFPADINYGFHTFTLFWFPLWAVLEPAMGTFVAVNVIIFLGCFLNGYALFVFLRGEKIAVPLALLSGLAVQALPISRYFYYNTHLNLMDWFWLPIQLMLWKQIVDAVETQAYKRLAFWIGIHGMALWGAAHTDLQFPLFIAFLLGPYALLTLWRSRQRLALLSAGIGTLALGIALFWVLGPLPYMLRFSGNRVISPVEERPGITVPEGFLSMSPTWWDWSTPTVGSFVTVCFIATFIYTLLYRKARPSDRWFWFAIMLPPLILSWGADLHIGLLTIPLPYRGMYALTDGMFRMPWRLAPVFLTAAAVFVGRTWAGKLPQARLGRAFLFGGLFLMLGFSIRLFETGPLQPVLPAYQFYESMREEPADYGVVEVPTGAGTGEVLLGDLRAIQFQYYGITHQKPMVNGFLARAPLDYYWYLYQDDPMMAWLGGRRPLEPQNVISALEERIFNWPIGYIVIHQDYVLANGQRPEAIYGFFNSLPSLVCPWAIEGQAIVYRTAWHSAGCPPRIPPQLESGAYQVDIGSTGDEAFLGAGWHWPESVAGLTLRWAGAQPQADLYLDLPPDEYEIEIAAQAFWETRTLQLQVNGQRLAEMAEVTTESLQPYRFTLPTEVVGDGQHLTVSLVYDSWRTPQEVLGSQDVRPLAVAVDWVRFSPKEQ